MNHDKQVAFRLPSDLVEQIDAQARSWSEQKPGMRVTRADVVRAILVQSLGWEANHEQLQAHAAKPQAAIPQQSKAPQASGRNASARKGREKTDSGLRLLNGDWDSL